MTKRGEKNIIQETFLTNHHHPYQTSPVHISHGYTGVGEELALHDPRKRKMKRGKKGGKREREREREEITRKMFVNSSFDRGARWWRVPLTRRATVSTPVKEFETRHPLIYHRTKWALMHNGQESSLIRVNRITRGAGDIVRRERKLAEKNARDGDIYIYIREEGWKRYSQGFPYPPPCYRVIFSFPSPRLSFPPPPPPPLLSTTIDLFLLVNPPTCNPLLLLRSQRHVFDDNSFNEIPLLF